MTIMRFVGLSLITGNGKWVNFAETFNFWDVVIRATIAGQPTIAILKQWFCDSSVHITIAGWDGKNPCTIFPLFWFLSQGVLTHQFQLGDTTKVKKIALKQLCTYIWIVIQLKPASMYGNKKEKHYLLNAPNRGKPKLVLKIKLNK